MDESKQTTVVMAIDKCFRCCRKDSTSLWRQQFLRLYVSLTAGRERDVYVPYEGGTGQRNGRPFYGFA